MGVPLGGLARARALVQAPVPDQAQAATPGGSREQDPQAGSGPTSAGQSLRGKCRRRRQG